MASGGGGSGVLGAAPPTVYDAVIVGAGQAGAAAAHRLRHLHGRSVLLIEAAQCAGGRTVNADLNMGGGGVGGELGGDDVLELGGTWLSPDHTAALGLCRELGLAVYDASFLDGAGEAVAVAAAEAEAAAEAGGPDWPWWFYGPDYSEAEMARLQRLVFHLHDDGGEGGGSRRELFRTPAELFAALGGEGAAAAKELEAAGAALGRDVEELGRRCGGGGGS